MSKLTIKPYQFTQNPFFILQSSIEDTIETLTKNYEVQIYHGHYHEKILAKAYQVITTPVLRIKAEIRWLINLEPSAISTLIKNINGDLIFESFDGITRINLIANGFPDIVQPDVLSMWINSWDGLSTESLCDDLNLLREKSGFTEILPKQLSNALEQLKNEHITALVANEIQFEKIQAWLLGQLSTRHRGILTSRDILVRLVNASQIFLANKIEQIKENVNSKISEYLKLSDQSNRQIQEKFDDEIRSLIDEWNFIYAPYAKANHLRGIENDVCILQLFSDMSDHFYYKKTTDDKYISQMRMLIKWLKYGIVIPALEYSSAADSFYNSVIKLEENFILSSIFKIKYPKLNQFADLIKDNYESFFDEIIETQFLDVISSDSLVNEFHQELVNVLAKSPEDRFAIYTYLTIHFTVKHLYIKHYKGICLFLNRLLILSKQYPVSDRNNTFEFEMLCFSGQKQAILAAVDYWYKQHELVILGEVIQFTETYLSDNDELNDALIEAGLKKTVYKTLNHEHYSFRDQFRSFGICVVVVILFLALIFGIQS